jgi:acetyl-CoA synthetase
VAIIHVGEEGAVRPWDYGRLRLAADGLAASLHARGVRRGDRVAVLLPQCPEVMIAHFAIMKLGAIVLPLFTLFGEDALRYRLEDSGAKALITDEANLDKAVALMFDLPSLERVYSTSPRAQSPVLSLWGEISRANGPWRTADTMADDPAVLIYTSGTTGPPKGVLHAHRFLLGHLPSVEAHHEGFPKPGDVGWTPADWAWIGGLMDMAMPCLHFGVPLVSHRMRKFDPDAAFALIRRFEVRNLFLPPTALKMMRQAVVPVGVGIRSISSGGESLGAELLEWGREVLGAPINEIYGQTECNLVLASCAGSMEVRPGSMGQAVPGFEVEIIDAEGRPLPPGEEGEIGVRAPNPVMFLEYWNNPQATAAKFVNGWLKTGDLGVRDEEGYFTFVARDDDVITSAGYRIGPSEIEHCLTGHPDVVMAAAVGVPDALRTEIVKAYVVLREGASWEGLEEALVARVREKISPHVAPRIIERVDSLPMTATGKIMRRALRERG